MMNVDWDSITGLVKIARMSDIPKGVVLDRMREITDHDNADLVATDARLRAVIDEVYQISELEMGSIKEWFLRGGATLKPEGDDEIAEALLKELGRRRAN